jgi:hypothetical protein
VRVRLRVSFEANKKRGIQYANVFDHVFVPKCQTEMVEWEGKNTHLLDWLPYPKIKFGGKIDGVDI